MNKFSFTAALSLSDLCKPKYVSDATCEHVLAGLDVRSPRPESEKESLEPHCVYFCCSFPFSAGFLVVRGGGSLHLGFSTFPLGAAAWQLAAALLRDMPRQAAGTASRGVLLAFCGVHSFYPFSWYSLDANGCITSP